MREGGRRSRDGAGLRWRCALIVAVLVGGLFSSRTIRGGVPVEGERELLDLLRAAQSTNKVGFQRGRLTAHIEARWHTVNDGQELDRTETGDVTLTWDGERTYYEYTHHGTRSDRDHGTSHAGRMLDLPDRRIWYNPEIGLAEVGLDKRKDSPWLVHVRPDQTWFRYFIPDGPTWKEILDPPETPNLRLVVKREGADRIIVEIHRGTSRDNKTQLGMRIIASLSEGGNVIAYEDLGAPGETPSWDKGEYEWVPDGRGNWRLKRLVRTGIDVHDDDRGELHYVLDVTEYDPEPVIPRSRFEMASLLLQPGTVVKESGGGRDRAYQIAGDQAKQPRVTQDILEQLAERLRDSRFAAPKTPE